MKYLSAIFLFFVYSGFAQDTTIVPTQTIKVKCFFIKKTGLFRNATQLDSTITNTNIANSYFERVCGDNNLPEINFANNDLIMVALALSGCDWPEVKYKLCKIKSQKKYLLMVDVYQKGMCKPQLPKTIIEMTPKLDSNYTFDYIVNTYY